MTCTFYQNAWAKRNSYKLPIHLWLMRGKTLSRRKSVQKLHFWLIMGRIRDATRFARASPIPLFLFETKQRGNKNMKTITLFFQNNETRTVVTVKPEQLKQFEISEIRTKWKMQNGQNQPISVIEKFDLIAENVTELTENDTLTMIVTNDGYELQRYHVEEDMPVKIKSLVDGELELHYDNKRPMQSPRDMFR